ncbi:MAG TPA: IPT/TIG domain-containing protein [Longimicrobium sp.]|nr:IPT/TIG domain-containing protein [Longimicrobium sp.]
MAPRPRSLRRFFRLGALPALLVLAPVACGDGTGGGPPPAPVLTEVSPASATAGGAPFTLEARGRDFTRESVVTWNGRDLATTFRSSRLLEAAVTAEDVRAGGMAQVTVHTPAPGGGRSAARAVEVRFPAPTLAALSIDTITVGRDGVEVALTGTGFAEGSRVRWNGADRPTAFVGPTRLVLTVPAADLQAAGPVQVAVLNPAPGGGTSAARTLTVLNPVPVVELLPVQGGREDGPGFALTVHGRGFVEGSVVRWNGADRPTTFRGPTRLVAEVPAADVAQAGAAQVSVRTPGPGGGTSNAAPFHVRPLPAAVLTSVRTLELRVAALEADPARGRIYASVQEDPLIPNHLAAIDAAAGTVAASVPAGEGPGALSRSDDGRYLYVAFQAESVVRRFDLPGLGGKVDIPLADERLAEDVEAVPGAPASVAVALRNRCCSPRHEGVVVFDGTTPRPVRGGPDHISNDLEFGASPSLLYAMDLETSEDALRRLTVAPDGVRHISGVGGLFYGGPITYAAGRIYTRLGSVVDAETLAELPRVPVDEYEVALFLPDPALGRAFAVTSTELQVFDLNTRTKVATVPLPPEVIYLRAKLVRWGPDGLAFADDTRVYLLRSPLFAP